MLCFKSDERCVLCTVTICVICQHVYIMSNFNTIFPASFAGSSDYLDSFFVQFEIECQINSWPDSQKAYWLCQCLEGPALSCINGLLEKSCLSVNYDVLKQALYQEYDPPENCSIYKSVFKNRQLNEGESIIAYGWDLKHLALKAYPDQTLQSLEPLIIKQFIHGLCSESWSDHVQFHSPSTLQDAIDIALEKKVFSDCFTCRQHSKYDLANNVYSTGSCIINKLARHAIKTQRYKPYDLCQIKCNRKPCTKSASRSLADVLLEHRQLQTSVSSEDHYAWDLVEVVVEIPYASKCHTSSTQQQSHVQTNPVTIISDLSQSSPLEDDDDVLLSDESTESTSFQASCNISTVKQSMPTKHEVSDYHSIRPPCLHKAVYKAVVKLKHKAYDNSKGDYYPNIRSYDQMPCATQTYGYRIRCWKRDFPD